MTARPWRAAAYLPMYPGRFYASCTSAKTRAGLDRFIAKWGDAGCTVDVWEVLPITAVPDATQVADSTSG